eukprot:COSAG01_NODE_23053_length_830_cov_1.062927_1_plen_201_part_01
MAGTHRQGNSQCSHITADAITGPWSKRDTAVPVWCHNPQLVPLHDGTYALFHLGLGTPPIHGPVNCTSGPRRRLADTSVETSGPMLGGGRSGIHTSASLDGPWTPLPFDTLPPSCNNPAPLQHPNGTLYLLCDETHLLRAEHIAGPWANVTSISNMNARGHNHGRRGVIHEDPVFWLDTKGRWHSLWHVYDDKINGTDGEP